MPEYRGRGRVGHGSLLTDPTRPIATARPTDLYAYLLITFASVTDCLKNKCFIHECLIYTENNFSGTSNSLNCVKFTITLSVTFCIIPGDPHRWTRPDPTRGWTRPMSNSGEGWQGEGGEAKLGFCVTLAHFSMHCGPLYQILQGSCPLSPTAFHIRIFS